MPTMKMNKTVIPELNFVLDCITDSEKKRLASALLIIMYIITFFGNLLVIAVILADHQLHEPMFVYIGTLATLDLAISSYVIGSMLSILLFNYSVVSQNVCLLQMAIVIYIEALISLILGIMAYDRYVAVLHPLRYHSIVTNKTVSAFLLLCNVFGFIAITPFIISAKELPFCKTTVLPFCFCDYSTMVHVACTNDPKYLFILSIITVIFGGGPVVMILFSYSNIAYSALKISSAEGKRKLYSTCSTQLLVVGLAYGPIFLSYMLPAAGVKWSTEAYNAMVIMGNISPPVFNPLIYSFRNQEIKKSIYKFFTRKRNAAQIGTRK
ncbi:olfactory receptor 7A10-like [Erpetoichthys calabaricus]|uniref:olfactory receptor 7A10-like n=1 Tax=Erpetoichthys calabaricus TaxID=27687 RepID=UPI002234C831|nr:olfactory receptor 7A10-like [Erpetoichthys calabaricus]